MAQRRTRRPRGEKLESRRLLALTGSPPLTDPQANAELAPYEEVATAVDPALVELDETIGILAQSQVVDQSVAGDPLPNETGEDANREESSWADFTGLFAHPSFIIAHNFAQPVSDGLDWQVGRANEGIFLVSWSGVYGTPEDARLQAAERGLQLFAPNTAEKYAIFEEVVMPNGGAWLPASRSGYGEAFVYWPEAYESEGSLVSDGRWDVDAWGNSEPNSPGEFYIEARVSQHRGPGIWMNDANPAGNPRGWVYVKPIPLSPTLEVSGVHESGGVVTLSVSLGGEGNSSFQFVLDAGDGREPVAMAVGAGSVTVEIGYDLPGEHLISLGVVTPYGKDIEVVSVIVELPPVVTVVKEEIEESVVRDEGPERVAELPVTDPLKSEPSADIPESNLTPISVIVTIEAPSDLSETVWEDVQAEIPTSPPAGQSDDSSDVSSDDMPNLNSIPTRNDPPQELSTADGPDIAEGAPEKRVNIATEDPLVTITASRSSIPEGDILDKVPVEQIDVPKADSHDPIADDTFAVMEPAKVETAEPVAPGDAAAVEASAQLIASTETLLPQTVFQAPILLTTYDELFAVFLGTDNVIAPPDSFLALRASEVLSAPNPVLVPKMTFDERLSSLQAGLLSDVLHEDISGHPAETLNVLHTPTDKTFLGTKELQPDYANWRKTSYATEKLYNRMKKPSFWADFLGAFVGVFTAIPAFFRDPLGAIEDSIKGLAETIKNPSRIFERPGALFGSLAGSFLLGGGIAGVSKVAPLAGQVLNVARNPVGYAAGKAWDASQRLFGGDSQSVKSAPWSVSNAEVPDGARGIRSVDEYYPFKGESDSNFFSPTSSPLPLPVRPRPLPSFVDLPIEEIPLISFPKQLEYMKDVVNFVTGDKWMGRGPFERWSKVASAYEVIVAIEDGDILKATYVGTTAILPPLPHLLVLAGEQYYKDLLKAHMEWNAIKETSYVWQSPPSIQVMSVSVGPMGFMWTMSSPHAEGVRKPIAHAPSKSA